MASFEHGYALLIGVGATQSPALSLPVTVKDMQAICAVLTDPQRCGYPDNAGHLRLLRDDRATRRAILDGLQWLQTQAEADPDATVIVYYSGHGELDTFSGDYFLLSYETDPRDIPHTALSAQDFTAALRAIPAKRLLVMVDSCHAEGMVTAKDASESEIPEDFTAASLPKGLIDALKQGAGRAVFTSSRGKQRSWLRPDKTLSLYTFHLLEALQGAANQPGDTVITLSNLMNHVGKTVPASAQALHLPQKQEPMFDLCSEDFPVALLCGGKGLPAQAAQTAPAAPGAHLTAQDNAHLESVIIGNGNQAMHQVSAGGHVIQAYNSTISLDSSDQAQQQAEHAAAREREQRYLSSVCEVCNKLDFLGLSDNATKQGRRNLASLYTALWTRDYAPEEQEAMPRRERQQRPRSAVEWLNQESRLALLGDPGSGKSTFVKFVALCLAGERAGHKQANLALLTAPLPDDDDEKKNKKKPQPWKHGAPLPVIIVLRDFAATALPDDDTPVTVEHLRNYLRNLLTGWGKADFMPDLDAALHREHGALLLFDGLDEVPEARQRRAQILQAIQAAATHLRCRILVTSRTYAYKDQHWALDGFADTVLAPFNQQQITSFVDRWYGEMADDGRLERGFADTRATALKQAITSRDQLRDLAKRPLLLTLMAVLHSSTNTELPDKRVELYKRATDVLLEWWEAGKGGEYKSLLETLNISGDALLSALNRLAFAAHQRQPLDKAASRTADIPQADLINELYKLNPAKVKEVQTHLCQRAGLLVSHGGEVYTFPHRSFQEYLAACHLIEDHDYPNNIAALLRDSPDRWREVVLLAAAKISNTPFTFNGLLHALCKQAAPKKPNTAAGVAAYSALLAAQAVLEAQYADELRDHERAMFTRLRGWLTAILTAQQPKQPLPALERANAGDLLAAFGDDRPGVALISPPLPVRVRTQTGGRGEGWVPGLPDIAWIDIPAGSFMMGSTDFDRSQPPHRVTFITGFQISRYPVTNAQYQAFIDAGGYDQQGYWDKDGWTWRMKNNISEPQRAGGAFDLPNHPVVGVSWYEAAAFCKWLTKKLTPNPLSLEKRGGEDPPSLSKRRGLGDELSLSPALSQKEGAGGEFLIRLPSEAEWEYAARGPHPPAPSPKIGEGEQGGIVSSPSLESGEGPGGEVIYPWGNEISPEHANYSDTGLGTTSAVGCFPRGTSSFGCEEMAGNVWEWCQDVWHDNYDGAPEDGRAWEEGKDTNLRLLKGASFRYDAEDLRCAYRNRYYRGNRINFRGFRLARAARRQYS